MDNTFFTLASICHKRKGELSRYHVSSQYKEFSILMRSQAKSTPWATLFFALLGLIWCGYVAFPTANPAPCATSGCALFRDGKIAGISLWWIGGAYFFFLAVLCLRGKRNLARICAALALFADAVLLIIMFLTAPCFDCLVVAALIGLCYYFLKPSADGWFSGSEVKSSILLPVWFGLLIGNSVLALNEQLPLHSLGNTRSSEIRVFFSPSCGACREALRSFGNAAALYPVMEKEDDFDSIVRFAALLKANVPVHEAILRSTNDKEPVPLLGLYDRSVLRLQLLRNKAALMRQGYRMLPLVLVNGWSGEKMSGGERSQTRQSPSQSALPQGAASYGENGFGALEHPHPAGPLPDFLSDPDAPLEQCGGEKPCD